MIGHGLPSDGIILDPGTRPGDLLMERLIGLGVCMNEDKPRELDPFLLQYIEAFQGCRSMARVTRDRQPGLLTANGRSPDDLLLNLDELAGIDGDLDEPGPDACALDAVAPFGDPALGQRGRVFAKGIGRQERPL